MPVALRHALPIALLASTVFIAAASSIEPGLWQITTRLENGGVTSPPRLSSKCLTADEVSDLPTTFSPIAQTINSECAPIERKFDGEKLTWRLVCKGQLDMELEGAFDFDSPHHYTGTVHSQASMAGQPMMNQQQMLDAQWISTCQE